MRTEAYTLPLVGEMLDWETLSGNPDDPLRVVAPTRFHRHWLRPGVTGALGPPGGVPANEGSVRVTLRALHLEDETAEVQVTAHERFHADFRAWLESASEADKCGGRRRLRSVP